MSKHRIIKDFFEPKVREISGIDLGFNYSPESNESISLVTNYADKVVRSFITGEQEKEYGFTFVITKMYSSDNDDLNLEAIEYADEFREWVDELNEAKTFPDLGEGITVQSIEVLGNMPNLAGVNHEEGLAVYQIQVRILYREVSK